jgi:hypothetical protein
MRARHCLPILQNGTERKPTSLIGLFKETNGPQSNRDLVTTETGEQVLARPHDSGSAVNETVDGLDATTEALRHAAEDTAFWLRSPRYRKDARF